VGILFLELKGYRFGASEQEAAQAVLGQASGDLDEVGYAAFLRATRQRKGSNLGPVTKKTDWSALADDFSPRHPFGAVM
jgi:hypothetical protein